MLSFWGFYGLVYAFKKGFPPLQTSDRWLGAALGGFKGLLIAFSLALLFQTIPENQRRNFGDLHRDSRNSIFIEASSFALKWDAIPVVKKLNFVQKNLAKNTESFFPLDESHLKSEPWARESGVDHD